MDARGHFGKLTNAFPSQAKSFHCDFLELPQETMVPGSHHSHLIVYNNPNTFWCQDYCPHCTETEKYTASQVEDSSPRPVPVKQEGKKKSESGYVEEFDTLQQKM